MTYTEFLMATSTKSVLLTEVQLKHLFSFIDNSGKSQLSREELKTFLGVNDDTYVGLIMEEADDDCDGVISLKEFTNLMLKMVVKNV